MDRPKRRSLLVASVGIATVSYALAACGKDQHPVSGNLPAPEPTPTQTTPPVTGNLPAPPPMDAAATPPMDAAATPSASASAKPAPKK